MDLERVAQAIADGLSDGEHRLWQVGDVLAALPSDRKGKLLKTLAGMVGRTAPFLSQLRTTSLAFKPDDRALDHSWKTHYICASTRRPRYWLDIAVSEDIPNRILLERMIEVGDKKRRKPRKPENLSPNVRSVVDAAWEVTRHGPELIPNLRQALEKLEAA